MGLVRSVDLAELRAFCAAVDLGSLGSAARLLRVSQPALSKRMRALEALAGAQLLVRSPRGIATTEAGERLYVEARKLLAQADAVEELMAGLSSEDAPVRLAVSHTIAEFVLPSRLVQYEQSRGRHLSVELVIANSVVVRELVGAGRAEFGIAAARIGSALPGLEQVHFCEDEVVVAVPHAHAWADLDVIEPEQLIAEPLVVRDPTANTRQTVDEALAARARAGAVTRGGRQHECRQGDRAVGGRTRPLVRDLTRARRRGLRGQARARPRPQTPVRTAHGLPGEPLAAGARTGRPFARRVITSG
jgi:DNA-binding transcriptional LysR family regulator